MEAQESKYYVAFKKYDGEKNTPACTWIEVTVVGAKNIKQAHQEAAKLVAPINGLIYCGCD